MNVNDSGAGLSRPHKCNIPEPTAGRWAKNTIRQEKRCSNGKMKSRNRISDTGQISNKAALQLFRLSKKKLPVSGGIGGSRFFNDSIDQFLNCINVSGLRCDGSGDGSMIITKFKKKSEINEDWGRRTELHNMFNINDGDKVWNIIRRGLFAEIKLWKNEYGNISCKATGKISVKGISERSVIEINTSENLRKLLNLSHMQWSALYEALEEKNTALTFNAFEEVDIKRKSSLEKLWFFICKRRHFLPNICVMGKLSGAVKLMRELQIMPKIVVTEVRDFKGEEIS